MIVMSNPSKWCGKDSQVVNILFCQLPLHDLVVINSSNDVTITLPVVPIRIVILVGVILLLLLITILVILIVLEIVVIVMIIITILTTLKINHYC